MLYETALIVFPQQQLQEKNDQLHLRLEQLQARYSELMNSKTQLSSKLISSEEEKLGVSDASCYLQWDIQL